MSLIERSEKRITDLIDAAPHPDGDFYADVLEVLRGRREQVETLRQQLAGAVEENARFECALTQARSRLMEGDVLGARLTISGALDGDAGGR